MIVVSSLHHSERFRTNQARGWRPIVIRAGSMVMAWTASSSIFDVLFDPRNQYIGNLQIVVVLHEHVAVAADADVRQGNERHVATRIPDLFLHRDAGGRRLRRCKVVTDDNQDRNIFQDANIRRRQIGKTSGLELNDAPDSHRARTQGRHRREWAGLRMSDQDCASELIGECRHVIR